MWNQCYVSASSYLRFLISSVWALCLMMTSQSLTLSRHCSFFFFFRGVGWGQQPQTPALSLSRKRMYYCHFSSSFRPDLGCMRFLFQMICWWRWIQVRRQSATNGGQSMWRKRTRTKWSWAESWSCCLTSWNCARRLETKCKWRLVWGLQRWVSGVWRSWGQGCGGLALEELGGGGCGEEKNSKQLGKQNNDHKKTWLYF